MGRREWKDRRAGQGFLFDDNGKREAGTLHEQLRQAIAGSGQTIQAIAKGSGIADRVLRRFMNGERDLTLTTASRLVEYFGMRLTGPSRHQEENGGGI